MDATTSDNYATTALFDETDTVSGVGATAATEPIAGPSRAARIARAVERSRLEYTPAHAYTDRQWTLDPVARADKHLLEYTVTSLYYNTPPACRRALDLILGVFDDSKPLGGLTREMVDTGTRCALGCADVEAGVKIAKVGAQHWRQPFLGLAESASDAFVAAGSTQEAFRPLLLASSSGLHQALTSRIGQLIASRPEPELQTFHAALTKYSGTIDTDAVAGLLQLDADLIAPLKEVGRRLERGVTDQPLAERSVRDL